MNNPETFTRCALTCLIALLGIALCMGHYLHAAEHPAPSLPLQSLRELTELEAVTTAPLIQSWRLKQGTRVLFVESHRLPMIDLKLSFAAGSYHDGDSPGLAAMTQSLFSGDSALKPANDIARGFDRYGVKITHGIDTEHSYYTLRSLSDKAILDPVIALFTETLTRPTFSEANLQRIRRSLQTDLKLEQSLPESRALALIRATLYKDHPLSRPVNGTTQSLERIDARQVRDFYRRAYTAANAHIVIVGDLTPEQARAFSQHLADALPQGPALAAAPTFTAAPSTGQHVHLEEDANRTLLLMMQNALPNQHPDAIAIRIANVVFSHVLNAQLREKYSVTYGVFSDIEHARGATGWMIQFSTPPSYSREALNLAKTLFAQFLKEGPSEEQLDTIKQYLRQALPQLMATNKNLLNELGIINRFDQALDFTLKTAEIQKMTPQQITAAMKRHLDADSWVSLTLGPSVEQRPLPDIVTGTPDTGQTCTSTNWASPGQHTLLGHRSVLWQLKHTPTPVTD